MSGRGESPPRRGGASRGPAATGARRGAVLALVAAVALSAPAGAHAAGTATLTVPASLKARGVTVAVNAPATLKARTVMFPLADSHGTPYLQARGALRLRAGGRSVTLGSPQLTSTRVSALLGGQRTTVLTLKGRSAKLAPTAARTIARRLKLRALPRAFGSVSTSVPAPSTPAPGACATTTTQGAAPDPGTGEPPVKPQPAGALAVAGATITWHPRESFIQYIASGEGTTATNGATGEPPSVQGASQAPLVYGFRFTSTGGWCDPATGSARLTFGGTVGFRYADHGIDLRVNDPEIELDGPASRVIFRMTGSGDTDGGNRRQVVETLDVSKAAAVRVEGKTLTYERIPAAVPPGAANSVFAGYYLPGDPFGSVSITFTTA